MSLKGTTTRRVKGREIILLESYSCEFKRDTICKGGRGRIGTSGTDFLVARKSLKQKPPFPNPKAETVFL
jgi:hypothetical protein